MTETAVTRNRFGPRLIHTELKLNSTNQVSPAVTLNSFKSKIFSCDCWFQAIWRQARRYPDARLD